MKQYQITKAGCLFVLALLLFSALFFLSMLWKILQSPVFWIGLGVLYLYQFFRRRRSAHQNIEQHEHTARQHDLARYEKYETLDEDE